ncbi:hypothetical protein CRUP_001197 [Coryphaenoides rupestris]|nr:hypothetical protein CRUP_001197 [Coryphaenoides rupestris]
MHSRLRIEGKVLVLLRGAPGSGKSTLAWAMLEQNPGGVLLSTDDYFSRDGEYYFDPSVLGEAHDWNHKRSQEAFARGASPIIIDNTNMQGWEMKPYVAQALRYNFKVLFREPDTWWKNKPRELARRNKHHVSAEKIRRILAGYERHVSIQSIMGSQLPKHSGEELEKEWEAEGRAQGSQANANPPGHCDVPYRMPHEKGTQVEEMEFGVARSRLENLRILSRHFKLVSFDILEDLYDKCHQDLEWTTNLLLDSGERFFRDDDDGTGQGYVWGEDEQDIATLCDTLERDLNIAELEESDKREEEQKLDERNSRRLLEESRSRHMDIRSLELKLPTELALQLTELFGPVGACSSDDYSVHMDLNLAKLLHQKWKDTIQTRQSRAELDRRDGATLLKEKQLYDLYPGIDRHFLHEIFRDHNYCLVETEQFLRSLLDEGPVKTVVAPEVARTEPNRTPSKEREKKPKLPDPVATSGYQFQDTVDPEYEDFRAEASLQKRRQQESLAKAAEAFKQGQKDVASFYAQQGHLHGQKMREANHRAAVQIFERVNASLLPMNVLDLHGLHVDEALQHLEQLSVITGRGNHSQGGVARIRPAVIEYLTNKHYRCLNPKP